MRKVHLISVVEPLLLDLALTLREKGYEISVSGCGLGNDAKEKLQVAGCTCYGDGWFPEKLTKDIYSVVLGVTVEHDNPELLRAKELGILVQSIPEFVFRCMRSKTRVVVAGNHGKKSIISMIAYTLRRQKLAFDYAFNSEIPFLGNRVQLKYESRIALIEGDEYVTSALCKRFQLEYYRPHVAILSSMGCPAESGNPSSTSSLSTYESFVASIEREGKFIYYGGDNTVNDLVATLREDVTAIPYREHAIVEIEGKTCLHTRYGDYPICILDPSFLVNLDASRLVCRQLGVKDADFYQAVSEYSLSLHA